MTEFIVYDLEYTSWPGSYERNWSGPGEHREIVQIGAVRLSADFHELAAFEMVVRPRINPHLSEYLIALTGITQERVEAEGRDFSDALAALESFAAPGCLLLANGTDAEVLAENCRLNRLADPFPGRTRNVQPELAAAKGSTKVISADLPRLFGLPEAGRGHDALADARNVAAALAILASEGKFSPARTRSCNRA